MTLALIIHDSVFRFINILRVQISVSPSIIYQFWNLFNINPISTMRKECNVLKFVEVVKNNYNYDNRLLLMSHIPFCTRKYWQNQFVNMLPIYCLRIGCIQLGTNSILDYVCHVFLCTSEFIKMPLQSIFSNFIIC